MAIFYKNFRLQIRNLGPIILLYFLSITEINTQFNEPFEIISFNLQLIIVYYWMLKDPSVLGSSHIFFAGLIKICSYSSSINHLLRRKLYRGKLVFLKSSKILMFVTK